MLARLPQYGFVPFHVRRESNGFIFNRIWTAIKHERFMVVEEGVAPPKTLISCPIVRRLRCRPVPADGTNWGWI